MRTAKYLLTPEDIAAYLFYSDFRRSEEAGIIRILFYTFNQMIVKKYRDDIRKFRTEIRNLMALYELTPQEYSEVIPLINEDTKPDDLRFSIPSYFKHIRLRLTFSNEEFVRIKMRTLIARFGYVKRTPYVLDEIQKSLRHLSLRVYTKNHQLCDLKTVGLDRMVIFRIAY